MKRYRYIILFFSLLILFGIVSIYLQPANNTFCSNYATLAAEQYNDSVKSACNFSGLQWSNDVDSQENWCLTVDELITSKKTLARAEALIECKANKLKTE